MRGTVGPVVRAPSRFPIANAVATTPAGRSTPEITSASVVVPVARALTVASLRGSVSR